MLYLITQAQTVRWRSSAGGVATLSQLGFAEQVFNVGDEKTFMLTDGTVMTAQIADFNHDVDASGNAIGITFVTKSALPYKYNYYMNNDYTVEGGWRDSEMRTYLNSDILELLGEEIQEVITPAKKYSLISNSTTSCAETEDKLFLLSSAEVNFNVTSAGYMNEGVPYAIFNDGANRRKDFPAGDVYANTGYWRLRSIYIGQGRFMCVEGYGNYTSSNLSAKDKGAICFAFCI